MSTETAANLREQVRQRYAEAARRADGGDGCGCGSGSYCEDEVGDPGEALYSAEQRGELPDAAVLDGVRVAAVHDDACSFGREACVVLPT